MKPASYSYGRGVLEKAMVFCAREYYAHLHYRYLRVFRRSLVGPMGLYPWVWKLCLREGRGVGLDLISLTGGAG